MLTGSLFHIALRTQDLEATVAFYTQVLGMSVDPNRPPFDFPGAWIQPSKPGAAACFHVYAGGAALEADGSFQTGMGVIDHVSITAQGIDAYRQRFADHGLPWRENKVPAAPLFQLFIHDPSGVQLELTFDLAAEPGAQIVVPPHLQYRPKERWFDLQPYAQWKRRLFASGSL